MTTTLCIVLQDKVTLKIASIYTVSPSLSEYNDFELLQNSYNKWGGARYNLFIVEQNISTDEAFRRIEEVTGATIDRYKIYQISILRPEEKEVFEQFTLRGPRETYTLQKVRVYPYFNKKYFAKLKESEFRKVESLIRDMLADRRGYMQYEVVEEVTEQKVISDTNELVETIQSFLDLDLTEVVNEWI